jgi:hypothetical protein
MILMRPVLAPDGKNIFMQKIECIRGYLGTPLVDFFFLPMAVEPEGCVG